MVIRIGFILLTAFLISCGENKNNQTTNEDSLSEDTSIEVGADDKLQEEADFLISSYMNSQLQIALGEVAARQALSPDVKEFSKTIIAENAEVRGNIEELASAAEIDLAPALTPEYLTLIDSIQSYEGAKFDSAFLHIVIEEHEDDIERLSNLATKTDNPIVRREVTENLALLQGQLTQAKEIEDTFD